MIIHSRLASLYLSLVLSVTLVIGCTIPRMLGRFHARLLRSVCLARVGRAIIAALVLACCRTTSHPNVPANTNTATLLGHRAAQLGAFHKSRESLGTEDVENIGGHRRSETEGAPAGLLRASNLIRVGHHFVWVLVPILLDLFHEGKIQVVLAFVAYAEVGEDEVPCLLGPVEKNHARDGHTSEHGRSILGANTAGMTFCGVMQTGVEEEIGVVHEGDILGSLSVGALEDSHLHHGRRVDGSTVGSSCIRGISRNGRI